MRRDAWSVWSGAVCLGAAALAGAFGALGWPVWLVVAFVIVAIAGFAGLVVTAPWRLALGAA